MITIKIDGKPIPWMRPGRKLINSNIIVYDKQAREKEKVKWQIKPQYCDPLISCPIFMDITFYMPIPKAASQKMRTQMVIDHCKPMKRPDVDNMAKFYLDCMTGMVFNDDAQITELNLRKVYGINPSVLIRIKPYSLNELPEPIQDDDDDDYL